MSVDFFEEKTTAETVVLCPNSGRMIKFGENWIFDLNLTNERFAKLVYEIPEMASGADWAQRMRSSDGNTLRQRGE